MNRKRMLAEYILIVIAIATFVTIFFLISPFNINSESFKKPVIEATLGELFLIIFIAVLSAGFLLRKGND